MRTSKLNGINMMVKSTKATAWPLSYFFIYYNLFNLLKTKYEEKHYFCNNRCIVFSFII